MASRFDRALSLTWSSAPWAVVPLLATLLSFDRLGRVLAAGPGFGVTFPFPTGLPTLWTYVAVPGNVTAGSGSLASALPVLAVAVVLTSALEAGFLGSLNDRVDGDRPDVIGNVARYTLPMIGATLVGYATVLLAVPFLVLGPLALLVVIVVGYLVYGLPFAIVVGDRGLFDALGWCVEHALDGGLYAAFAFAHLFVGALASVLLTGVARTLELSGILVAAVAVSLPAVAVAYYGLLVFRELDDAASSPVA